MLNFNDAIEALDTDTEEAVRIMEAWLIQRTEEINALIAQKNINKLRQLIEEEQRNLTRLKTEREETAKTLNNIKNLKNYDLG